MDRLGVFGGTFDPPHCGHLTLANEAARQLKLNLVLWVLTPDPPHKRGRKITPWQIRLEMVEAAVASMPQFKISLVDVDRPPPQYAVDTVRLLRQGYPGFELVYLIGGDSLRDLPTWHQPDEFLARIDWLGVMRRPHIRYDLEKLENFLPGLTMKILWIDAPLLDISSTRTRRNMSTDLDCGEEIPEAVCQVIKERHLYQGT
jgi:nicotinate-nucleotide adenylyltransferase